MGGCIVSGKVELELHASAGMNLGCSDYGEKADGSTLGIVQPHGLARRTAGIVLDRDASFRLIKILRGEK